jgi:hypothetical protein
LAGFRSPVSRFLFSIFPLFDSPFREGCWRMRFGTADESRKHTVIEQVLLQRGTTLVRRLRLAPGEATPWHRDPFQRVTVIVSGDALAIEYRDGGETDRLTVTAGQADWDEPTDRVHRGVNVGARVYEEITLFFLDRPDAVPQPRDG